jgi:hypothetical protein
VISESCFKKLQFLKMEFQTGKPKVRQHHCWMRCAIPSTDNIRRSNLIFSKDPDVTVSHGQKRSHDHENDAGGSDYDIHTTKRKRLE